MRTTEHVGVGTRLADSLALGTNEIAHHKTPLGSASMSETVASACYVYMIQLCADDLMEHHKNCVRRDRACWLVVGKELPPPALS